MSNNPLILQLNEIAVEIIQKNIKNLHLRVYPPTGRVRVSAPKSMAIETIRIYVVSKLDWIRKQQAKLCSQVRETPRECIERESHYVGGKRYLMQVVERHAVPRVSLSHTKIVLQVRPGADEVKKRAVLDEWYRQQLKEKVGELVGHWQPKMAVSVEKITIRKMKTRWGSCTPVARSIRINLELAKKPPECLEYVVVHELAHLLEPSHNQRFIALMDKYLPQWRSCRDVLNALPIGYEKFRC